MLFIIKRSLSSITKQKNIGQIFFNENVQQYLKEISRFEESKVFSRRHVKRLETPQLMFMSNEQLELAKQNAYEEAKGRLQMPPVLEPDTTEPEVLAKDDAIVGYTKFKVMFVDISPGSTNRSRLMSVRETDGTLRYPTHEERSRLNHMFYPGQSKSIDCPKLFEAENLSRLMRNGEYIYILDRACMQFEPDDPRYVDITSQVYKYIDEKKHYDKLRSSRHFGPLSLYLAYNKRADGLIADMVTRGHKEDAAKLVKIYNICHDIDFDEQADNESILGDYIEQHSLSNLL